MQIQEHGHRISAADARGETLESFRAISRPLMETSSDAFAQIFQAISSSSKPKAQARLPGAPDQSPIQNRPPDEEEKEDAAESTDEVIQVDSIVSALPLLDQSMAPVTLPVITDESSVSIDESAAKKTAGSSTEPTDSRDADNRTDSDFEHAKNSAKQDRTSIQSVVSTDPDAHDVQTEATVETQSDAKSNRSLDKASQLEPSERPREGTFDIDASLGSENTISSGELAETFWAPKAKPAESAASDTSDTGPLSSGVASEDAASTKGRDRHARRDRGNAREVNASRQESQNATKDRQSSSSLQGAANASATGQSNAAESVPPASPSQPPAATTMATPPPSAATLGPAATIGAAAGVVAGSSPQAATSANQASSDSFVMGVGTKPSESLTESTSGNATTPSRQSEVADRARLVHRISKAFQKMGVDGGHVRLKMHPEELGGVQLEMQVSGRTVRATVTAETEQARQVIQANLPELRQRLEGQGLLIERLDVQTQAERENAGDSFGNQQNNGTDFGNGSDRRDGVWRRQDEARSGRVDSSSELLRAQRSDLQTVTNRNMGAMQLDDRSLDVKL